MIDPFTYVIYLCLLSLVLGLLYLSTLNQPCSLSPINITSFTSISPFTFLALIFISFIVGFRYDVGVDWVGYRDWFEYLALNPTVTPNDEYMEVGYFFINKLIASFGGNYEIMFFVVAFISWYFIFRSVPVALLPLTVFFLFADEYFFWSMNGVRQFVAISIFLYAIKYIISSNYKMYFFCIIFAASFHFSVLLLAPLYFIPYQKLYNKNMWTTVFVCSLFLGNIPFIVDGLQQLIRVVVGDIPSLSVYLRYLSGHEQFTAQEVELGMGYLYRILVTFLILFFSGEVVEKYPKTKVYFVLFLTGAVIFNLFYMFQIVGRFNNYFLIIRSIVLALIIYYLWVDKKYYVIPTGVVISYFILFLAAIYKSSNMCSPFQFGFIF